MIAQHSTHGRFSPQEINQNIMRSVLNGKYTLKQTIHDSCWKWKTDVLQRRECIWPQAAKTRRPKFRPMNFILVSECTCTHSGSAPCSMCIAPSLQNLQTALPLADGTEKNPRAQRHCQNGNSLPLLTVKALSLLTAPKVGILGGTAKIHVF